MKFSPSGIAAVFFLIWTSIFLWTMIILAMVPWIASLPFVLQSAVIATIYTIFLSPSTLSKITDQNTWY